MSELLVFPNKVSEAIHAAKRELWLSETLGKKAKILPEHLGDLIAAAEKGLKVTEEEIEALKGAQSIRRTYERIL